MRPQPGDPIVHRFGDQIGQPVKPQDVPEGDLLLQVVSQDPQSGKMRDGSRLNGVNLVRIDEKLLNKETSQYAVAGVIAYSSVCTHQGCDLTQWVPKTTTFKCYCHYSEFDVTHMGQPRHGPAKRRLAVLPLELNDAGELIVKGPFVGKVGFKK
ncbi:MAG: Rieske 2Fe-2S domain-containing protein [Burkholderiaceae bacterium]